VLFTSGSNTAIYGVISWKNDCQGGIALELLRDLGRVQVFFGALIHGTPKIRPKVMQIWYTGPLVAWGTCFAMMLPPLLNSILAPLLPRRADFS
jgi:hypothetical protein